jgi:TfoX/Sxy family transcriptional regulator of competence genes
MSKTSPQIPQDKLDLYDKLIATNSNIERVVVTMPYTSVNGHMFTILSKTGSLGLRLSASDREEFLEKYQTTLYESHGAIMKEYVTVPGDLLERTKDLKTYVDKSFAFTKSLKPKPTKRKKK